MMELSEIQRRLKDRNLAKIAREIHMTYKTIWKVANISLDEENRISHKTIIKITEYLEAHQ